jgi:hypothetical protein
MDECASTCMYVAFLQCISACRELEGGIEGEVVEMAIGNMYVYCTKLFDVLDHLKKRGKLRSYADINVNKCTVFSPQKILIIVHVKSKSKDSR